MAWSGFHTKRWVQYFHDGHKKLYLLIDSQTDLTFIFFFWLFLTVKRLRVLRSERSFKPCYNSYMLLILDGGSENVSYYLLEEKLFLCGIFFPSSVYTRLVSRWAEKCARSVKTGFLFPYFERLPLGAIHFSW